MPPPPPPRLNSTQARANKPALARRQHQPIPPTLNPPPQEHKCGMVRTYVFCLLGDTFMRINIKEKPPALTHSYLESARSLTCVAVINTLTHPYQRDCRHFCVLAHILEPGVLFHPTRLSRFSLRDALIHAMTHIHTPLPRSCQFNLHVAALQGHGDGEGVGEDGTIAENNGQWYRGPSDYRQLRALMMRT